MSDALHDLTLRLKAGRSLSPAEVALAAADLAAPEVPSAAKEEFLAALADKGETAGEIAAFAAEFRARAVDPGVAEWAGEAIDIVGTGGDHAGGFNVSSLVVLVLASAGQSVMKHGNRGITSKCGSADLMAGFGVELEAPAERQRAALRELGFAFFFAPAYHPAFRHIGPARKALAAKGRRTIFNVLGPLLNPGRPAHVLLGVYSPEWLPTLVQASDALGAAAGLAVHGAIGGGRGIDELTTATNNQVRGIGRLAHVAGEWKAGDVGLATAPFSDLQGGDLAANLALTERIVSARGPAGLVDSIVWNAAVALWICGRVESVKEGISAARQLLLGGAVKRKLDQTREFYRSK